MRKRILLTILMIVMAIGVTGCGEKTTAESATNEIRETKEEKKEEKQKDAQENTKSESEEITEDIEKKSIQEYAQIVFEAYQNLDYETLKPYLDEEEYKEVSTTFQIILRSEEDTEFWKNTIGTAIYLPESDMIISKSIDYIVAQWYMDCWKNNAEIPASDSEDFPVEYLDGIYDKFYDDAKWEVSYDVTSGFVQEKNGKISCNVGSIAKKIVGEELDTLFYLVSSFEGNYSPNRLRSAILLDDESALTLGYDYINDTIPDYEAFLSKDLNRYVEVIDAVEAPDSGNTFYKEYNYYYKDEQNREILQQFINDNCEVYRDLSRIIFFVTMDYDKLYPFRIYQLTENDKAYLEKMGIEVVYTCTILECPDYFWSSNFSPLNEIASYAGELGLLEEFKLFNF